MSLPYVYRITDRETGLRYIGVRFAAGCCPEELGVSYFTSSRHIEPLFRGNPNRFEKQIVVTGSKEYVMCVEKSLIDFHDAVRSNQYYNRTNNRAIHPDDVRAGREKVSREQYSALGKKGGAVTGPRNTELLRRIAAKGGKVAGKLNCAVKMICLDCGMVTNPGNVARHSKAKGHIRWEKVT